MHGQRERSEGVQAGREVDGEPMSLVSPIITGLAALAPLARQTTDTIQTVSSRFGKVFSSNPEIKPRGGEEASGTTVDRPPELDELRQTLLHRLALAGVDLSQSIEITLSPLGNLTVTGAHPDLLEIDRVLSSDPDLVPQFQRTAHAVASADEGRAPRDWALPFPVEDRLAQDFEIVIRVESFDFRWR